MSIGSTEGDSLDGVSEDLLLFMFQGIFGKSLNLFSRNGGVKGWKFIQFGGNSLSLDLFVFDTLCDPGEPSKREGEERKCAWTVSGSEESEHMSRCMLGANFATPLLSFFKKTICWV